MYKGYKINQSAIESQNSITISYMENHASIRSSIITETQNYSHKIFSFLNENFHTIKTASHNFSVHNQQTEDILKYFPLADRHVFLSHSRKDTSLVLDFASWLKRNFGISSFIDSNVWNHFEEISDSKFSAIEIEWALKIALRKMIDKCECFIFVDTINSLIESLHETFTPSKWISEEIKNSQTIEKRIPQHILEQITNYSGSTKSAVEILAESYPVHLSHLLELTEDKLNRWKSNGNHSSPEHSLRYLYNNLHSQK